jgi:hypothetical protein
MAPWEPAAIRHKNPGAMWPGRIATKWGSKKWVYLNDGTGQGGGGHGNKIATFENWNDGICAQLDLWRNSVNYKNQRFADAIAVWCGHNHVGEYIAHVKRLIPGMNENTIMNDAFWRGPNGLRFLQVQAAHEAGKTMPVPQDVWVAAQKRALSGVPTANTVIKGAGSVVTGTVTGTLTGVQGGLSLGTALVIGLVVAVVVFLVWKFRPEKAEKQLPATPVSPTPVIVGTSEEKPE